MAPASPNSSSLLIIVSFLTISLIFTQTQSISSFEFESAISSLRAHNYHLFGNALATSDLQIFFLSSNSSFTLFAPTDSALFSLDMASSASNYVNSLQCHVALGRFSLSDLLALRNGSAIGTLVPGRDLSIGHEMNDGVDTAIVDGVRVAVPNVFNGDDLIVHGLDGILGLRRRKKRLDPKVEESGSTVLDPNPPSNSPPNISPAPQSGSPTTKAPRISPVSPSISPSISHVSPSISPESRNPPSVTPIPSVLPPLSNSVNNEIPLEINERLPPVEFSNENYHCEAKDEGVMCVNNRRLDYEIGAFDGTIEVPVELVRDDAL